MKAAIYNPYLDTLGGGERYTIEFARALLEFGYQVDLEWSDKDILSKLDLRFGKNFTKGLNLVADINRGKDYDLCFWVSDGSVPTLNTRKNILHFQVPFTNVNGRSLLNKMKLFRVDHIVCNSNFTKSVIDNEFGVNSTVIYPPIDTKSFVSKRKENIILYVGRFSKLLQSKGQEHLVDAFKKFHDSGQKGWKLIIAGGVEMGADSLSLLKEKAAGYPIEIIESPNFEKIKDLFAKAKIFWSASGFGVDESKKPERVEHFGMTVVESMSAGCIPIVINAGGHKEIIDDGQNGFLWHNVDELVEYTKKVVKTKGMQSKLSNAAKLKSKKFDITSFQNNIKNIL